MTETDYIPPDPKLGALLDAAYTATMRTLEHNLRQMKRADKYHHALAPGKAVVLVDDDGQQVDFENPRTLRYYRRETRLMWQQFRRDFDSAQTAQEQMGSLLQLLRESFSLVAYTGNNRAVPRFFDELVNRVASKYEDTPQDEMLAEAEAADNITRIGRSQRAYLQESFHDFCAYSNMCLESLDDIELLTEQYEATHLRSGETPAKTPYDVVFRRYYRARDEDPMDYNTIDESDKAEFLDDEKKFYLNELYAPFRDLMPDGKPCLELAWFVGAAIDAVRIEEVERLMEQDQRFVKLVQRSKQGPLRQYKALNDNGGDEPVSFAERVGHTCVQPASPRGAAGFDNDVGRTDREIFGDADACRRIIEIIQDVADTYPNFATDVEELLAAKEYFHNMYLGQGPEHTVGMQR